MQTVHAASGIDRKTDQEHCRTAWNSEIFTPPKIKNKRIKSMPGVMRFPI